MHPFPQTPILLARAFVRAGLLLRGRAR